MAFQPVPDTVEIDINMILDDQLCQNTLYGRGLSGEPSQSDVTTIATAVKLWWGDFYAARTATACVLRDVEAKGLWSQSAFYHVTNSGQAGGVVSPPLPNHNTWVVKFTTGQIGRSQRGRNYIVGLTESQVTNNEIPLTLANDWVNVYEELFPVFASAQMEWVIVSRRTNNAERPAGVTSAVTGVSFEDLYVDSQRRRLPGRGR